MSLNFENQQSYFHKIHKHFLLFLFYNVHKKKMFTIEIEGVREERQKSLVIYTLLVLFVSNKRQII